MYLDDCKSVPSAGDVCTFSVTYCSYKRAEESITFRCDNVENCVSWITTINTVRYLKKCFNQIIIFE